MNKCKFWYDFYLRKKQADLVINNAKALFECLKTPVLGVVIGAAITAKSEIEMKKINKMLILGPICGSHPVKNGQVCLDETY